jgi:hypothetical protein
MPANMPVTSLVVLACCWSLATLIWENWFIIKKRKSCWLTSSAFTG